MEDNRKELISKIPADYQDYVEWRLHSHTESSLKVIQPILQELKDLTTIIKAHDAVLTNDNIVSLLEIIHEYQTMKIVHENDRERSQKVIYYGKMVIWVSAVLGAFAYIGDQVSKHLRW